jgi:hypothetical protein
MEPMPVELRHVYRALLRAVTYLPDSAARSYMHRYVVYRFRSVSDNIKSARYVPSRKSRLDKYHHSKNIAKAWQAARQLERAGQGSSPDLKKVLLITYGRTGKRKRELVQDLRTEDGSLPQDESALEQPIREPMKATSMIPPKSKMAIFIQSQQANQPVEKQNLKIRDSTPKIPAENIWGRPVPMKLQQSMKQRHFASVLERILPPIPEYEWNRLQDLATGGIPIEEPPPRRSRPDKRQPLTGEENDAMALEYLTSPANTHGFGFGDVQINAELGLTCWAKPVKGLKIERKDAYTSTSRFMRRLYGSIWNLTSTMSHDGPKKEWTVKWGGSRSPSQLGNITAPTARDLELFEGLEETKKPQPS